MLQLDDQGAREEVRAALQEVREISRRLRPRRWTTFAYPPPPSDRSLRASSSGPGFMSTGHPHARTAQPGTGAGRLSDRPRGLTNALRHGNGAQVRVQLHSHDGATVLVVEDTGPGVAADSVDGTGIRGMRERAVLVGAQLDLRTSTGGGMRVRLVLEERPGE